MKFSVRLNKVLKKMKMNQAKLSRKTRITPAMVCHYCNGTRIPGLENAIKISKALGVSLDYLTGTDRLESVGRGLSVHREMLRKFLKLSKRDQKRVERVISNICLWTGK